MIKVSMELYYIFYLVAQNGSFSKAAKKLFVSQSAISQSIKKLEEELLCQLFVRTTKNINLTISGEVLFENLETAFSIIQYAEKNITLREDPLHGEINIASTDTLCKYQILPAIKKINELYPDIKFKISNGTSLKCLAMLEKADVDFAFININDSIDLKKFVIEKSFEFKDVFVSKKDLEVKKNISLEELSKFPLLVLDDKTITRAYFNQLFKNKGIEIKPDIELQSVDILIEMAKAGLGISFVPDICLKNENDLKIISIKENILARKYGMISLKQLPLNSLGKLFKEMLVL